MIRQFLLTLLGANAPAPIPKTVEQVKVEMWALCVKAVVSVFVGSAFAILYSVTFVQQPMSGMAPIDKVYTQLLRDIIMISIGSIGTMIGSLAADKALTAIAEKITQPEEGAKDGQAT